MIEESKKQTAANQALESEKAELTSKVEALTEECSKAVATLEGEKEQLTLNIERLTQDCTRETDAKKVLDSDKQELVQKLEVMTEESKEEVAANKALEREKDELTFKVEALTEECSKAVAANRVLDEDIKRLSHKLKDNVDTIGSLKLVIQENQDVARKFQEERQQKIKQMLVADAAAAAHIITLKTEITSLQDKLEAKDGELQTLVQHKSEQQSEMEALEDCKRTIQIELERAQSDLKMQTHENDKAQGEVKRLQRESEHERQHLGNKFAEEMDRSAIAHGPQVLLVNELVVNKSEVATIKSQDAHVKLKSPSLCVCLNQTALFFPPPLLFPYSPPLRFLSLSSVELVT
jgi:chromosome segregation ATPase